MPLKDTDSLRDFCKAPAYTTADVHKGAALSWSSIYSCWEEYAALAVYWPICNFNTRFTDGERVAGRDIFPQE
jgi:hypothetical protein